MYFSFQFFSCLATFYNFLLESDHQLNDISLFLFQSDHIKRLLLYIQLKAQTCSAAFRNFLFGMVRMKEKSDDQDETDDQQGQENDDKGQSKNGPFGFLNL
jgi:hypothetical protein